ncbi:MAG: nuclear transport factor 2 family protein [Rhodospirillales bacterium]
MTEEEASNVAKLRAGYDLWNSTKGDPQVWVDVLAEEIDFRSIGDGRPGLEFTHAYSRKKDLFLEFFEGLHRDWRMDYYRIEEYIATGDRVVALGHTKWFHKRTDKIIDTPKADVWRFRDGKAIQFMEFMDTQMMVEATRG